jgi:hypothetical protein
VGGMSSTRVGVFIEGLEMKFVFYFCVYLFIFGLQMVKNGKLQRASTRGPNRSRHLALARYSRSSASACRPPLARGALQHKRDQDDIARSRRTMVASPAGFLPPHTPPNPPRSRSSPHWHQPYACLNFFAQTLCSNFMKLVPSI